MNIRFDPDRQLVGRVALVTGAGRGLGRAIAVALAQHGATIVAVARTQADLDELSADLDHHDARCVAVAGDVAEPSTATRAVTAARDLFGRLDIVVNAAGVQGPLTPVADTVLISWEETLRVSATGTFLICRAALPLLRESSHAVILNVASRLAVRVQPNFAAHSSAKAAVVQFSRVLAAEEASNGIRVNAVHPGLVLTDQTSAVLQMDPAAAPPGLIEHFEKRSAAGEFVTPETSAAMFAFLASDDAAHISGHFLLPDDPLLAPVHLPQPTVLLKGSTS